MVSQAYKLNYQTPGYHYTDKPEGKVNTLLPALQMYKVIQDSKSYFNYTETRYHNTVKQHIL